MASPRARSAGITESMLSEVLCEMEENEAESLSSLRRLFRKAKRPGPAAAAPPPAMHALVALQRAEGSWDLTRELADVVGRSLQELESALAGATGEDRDVRKAWATALALVWLRTHARHVEGEWSLLAAKARAWLDNVAAVPAGGGAWYDAAAAFLRR